MKTVIATTAAPGAIGPYSQAIEAGGFVFVSGQLPLDPATGAFVPGGVEEQAEQTGELLAWLHRGIGLMNLQQKEQYGKTAGPLWGSVLLGFLRNRDVLPPAEDTPARLANCDDLRPLEQDNCLWDILLLHKYVAFTVQPPYAPKALECAALHALLDPERNPAQDKTVAEFLGVSRAAVSQRRKTWQQKLVQMKTEQEDG